MTIRLRTLIIALFVLSFGNTQAQILFKDVTFNNIIYKVYPLRITGEISVDIDENGYKRSVDVGVIRNFESPSGESFLPFVPINLENGLYLAYYPKKWGKTDEQGNPIYSHEDTTKIAVIFEIKNNLRHGEFIWYSPYDQSVIQSGSYENGLKSGLWHVKYGENSATYSYKKGLLDGEFKRFKEGKLMYECNYSSGELNGKARTYYSNGGLDNEINYTNGVVNKVENYSERGVLVELESPLANDTIVKEFNWATGELVRFTLKTKDTGIVLSKSFYNNGSLKYEQLKFKNLKAKANLLSAEHHKFIDIVTKAFGDNRLTISMSYFYPDGKTIYNYDIRQMDSSTVIHEYDSKGKSIRKASIIFLPSDTVGVWLKEERTADYLQANSFGKNKKNQSEELWYSSLQPIVLCRITTDKKGKKSYNRFPFFLSHYYSDSVGVALMNETHEKGKLVVQRYNILHTSDNIQRESVKGKIFKDFTVNGCMPNDNSKILIVQKQWSKDRTFRIDHSIEVSIKNNPYYASYDGSLEFQKIMEVYDTIDYLVYYKNELFSGNVYFTDKGKFRNIEYKTTFEESKTINGIDKIYLTRFNKSADLVYGEATFYKGSLGLLKSNKLFKPAEYEYGKLSGEYVSADELNSQYYIDGVKHGTARGNNRIASYYQNQLHGDFVRYGAYAGIRHLKYQPNSSIHFHLDTVHGWWLKFSSPNVLKEKIYIEKGLPHGDYWRGNISSPISAKAKLNQGFLYDTAFYYFSEGQLKVSCFHQLKDSQFYSEWHHRNYRLVNTNGRFSGMYPLDSRNLLDFNSNRTGDYVYYYKNGVMSQKGRVEDGFRVGTWEFWDLNGGKLKTISYEVGVYISPHTGDSVLYYGKIEMWHPNGQPLLSGLVISESTQFKCDQELEVNFENVFYLSQFDMHGVQLLSNNSGNVFEYHNNGEIRLEGAIIDGLRTGIWKFYDPDGRLEEIGAYEKGQKQGLWIKGDLEAVPHFYDRCIKGETAPYSLPDVEKQGFVLAPVRINESYFLDDEMHYEQITELMPLFGNFREYRKTRNASISNREALYYYK